MSRGWTDNDPAKGTPHRRTREKISLLLNDLQGDSEALVAVIDKIAEKHPDAVLDAVLWAADPDADLPVRRKDLGPHGNWLNELADASMRAAQDKFFLDDDGPVVCVTHLRFLPCRKDAGCVYSRDETEIARVRAYQNGEGA
ncbi:MAG TPA: hypothetical protein VHE33_10500 [Acidobacteriaceae bacterium]|nr:hypothetical protein [Acidobacteriaceae bacterium]